MSETRRRCGVPSERRSVFPGGFPGLAPWAGMRCPIRAWDQKIGGVCGGVKVDRGRPGLQFFQPRGGGVFVARERGSSMEDVGKVG